MKNLTKLNSTEVIRKTKKKITDVLNHAQFILGPEVEEIENKLANFTKSKYCIAVSSGTDALLISLMSLNIKPGDEIITSPFSWISTVEVIAFLGAKPIFVDIDERTFNIDSKKISKAITKKTKAIIPVSLFGQCSDMDAINKIAKEFGIPVIEDAAQSFGAIYKERKSCNLSTIGCTSFFPTKPLGSFGDAGACFTNNKRLYEKMRSIRNHGQRGIRYNYKYIGVNGRMDTLQAAILVEKLNVFNDSIVKRKKVAKRYDKFLSGHDYINRPLISEFNTSVYAQYTIKIDNRDKIKQLMAKKNIPTYVFYPKPLNKISYLKNKQKNLSIVNNISKKVLSLPINEFITSNEQEYVIENLIKAHNKIA